MGGTWGLVRGTTRAAQAETAGTSRDAAGLKRAREVTRARARGCGGMGGADAVFRRGRGGEARPAERVRAVGHVGLFRPRRPGALHRPSPRPLPPGDGRWAEKDRNPLTAASRIAALLFAGRARNVVLERMASIYIMLCLRFASFFRLKPQKPHLLPLCRFHRGTLFRH
ncbi:hypothetical protein H8959_013466 [Pygathrix nigripes]